jgi:hypothetical protein
MTDSPHWLAVVPELGVACPRRGAVVDLARCLACNWLIDLDRTGVVPSLLCAAADAIADGRRPSEAHAHID